MPLEDRGSAGGRGGQTYAVESVRRPVTQASSGFSQTFIRPLFVTLSGDAPGSDCADLPEPERDPVRAKQTLRERDLQTAVVAIRRGGSRKLQTRRVRWRPAVVLLESTRGCRAACADAAHRRSPGVMDLRPGVRDGRAPDPGAAARRPAAKRWAPRRRLPGGSSPARSQKTAGRTVQRPVGGGGAQRRSSKRILRC